MIESGYDDDMVVVNECFQASSGIDSDGVKDLTCSKFLVFSFTKVIRVQLRNCGSHDGLTCWTEKYCSRNDAVMYDDGLADHFVLGGLRTTASPSDLALLRC